MFEAGDPEQMGGYTYAANNPISGSDPTGLRNDTQYFSPTSDPNNNLPAVVDVGGGVYMSTADSHFEKFANRGKSIAWHAMSREADSRRDQLDSWLGFCNDPTIAADCGSSFVQKLQEQLNNLGSNGPLNGYDPIGLRPDGQASILKNWDDTADEANIAASFAEQTGLGSGASSASGIVAAAFEAAGGALGSKFGRMAAGTQFPHAADETEDVDTPAAFVCSNSFAATTSVLMADGSSKPISKIKVGDQVEAADPRTGKFEGAREVTKVWLNHDSDLVDVTVDDGRGHVATLHTTAGHLFWDATLGMWIDANDLMAGDLLAGPGVQGAHVDAVTPVTGPAERYNLTVADLHTYYVIAGDTTTLVHNDGGDSSTDTGTDVDDNGVGTIFRDGPYRFQIYSNDHPPAHGHLLGPGIFGNGIQIGQNGKPLEDVKLTKAQQKVIDNNLSTIRKALGKRMAAFKRNQCG